MSKDSIFADVMTSREYPVPDVYDGFTITLRNELSVGERRKVFGNAVIGQTDLGDGKVRNEYDFTKMAFSTVLAYLVEWSEKKEITPDTIAALKPSVFEAIEKVVNAHIEAQEPARPSKRQGKGSPATKTSDAAISPFVAS